jgi:hypothetical protein
VEDVEGADDRLDRRPPEPAPGAPPRLRSRQQRQSQLDGKPGERLADAALATRPGRAERDHLDTRAGKPCDEPAQVVADPRARAGERADVDDNAHAPASGGWNRQDERLRARLGEPEDPLADEVDGQRPAGTGVLERQLQLDAYGLSG